MTGYEFVKALRGVDFANKQFLEQGGSLDLKILGQAITQNIRTSKDDYLRQNLEVPGSNLAR